MTLSNEEIIGFGSYCIKNIKNSVKIKTNTSMSNSEESYVDLEASGTRFTISKDKPLRLVTPTLDAGDIYVFSIAGTDGKE